MMAALRFGFAFICLPLVDPSTACRPVPLWDRASFFLG